MKNRGFTLIELLIVTVVIAILMAIVFRLAGTGSESSARAKTISRLQKLSNALSGYYAAFGCYPPVPLQGRSRDIYTRVSGSALGYGIQSTPDDRNKTLNKKQIEAACRAQPVAVGFPYDPKGKADELFAAVHEVYGIPLYRTIKSYSSLGVNRYSSAWQSNNVFMFGLLSFLLPRYQFMLEGESNMYNVFANSTGPWATNNRLPYLLNGERLPNWTDGQNWMGTESRASSDKKRKAMIEQLPSQAVCARWMPNFEGIVETRPFILGRTKYFGVETEMPEDNALDTGKWLVFGEKGYESGNDVPYGNCVKSVRDGWGEDLYYYSPPPYQSYQLWSSGPNKRTFPPWMEKPSGEEKRVDEWIADDIKVGDK